MNLSCWYEARKAFWWKRHVAFGIRTSIGFLIVVTRHEEDESATGDKQKQTRTLAVNDD
jgi:hypothetical protein